MKLRLTPRALRNLAEIAEYLGRHSPTTARNVRAAILGSLDNLLLFPESGRRQSIPGIRKLLTRRYPYLVYYTIKEESDEIVILSIKHPSRKREHDDA